MTAHNNHSVGFLVVPNCRRSRRNDNHNKTFTLVLAVPGDFRAAYTDAATTSPGCGPATAPGGVVGTADAQHGGSTPAPTPAGRAPNSRAARPADGSPTA